MDALAITTSIAQECIRQFPVILLGSGASAAHGIPGMWPLGDHLRKSTPPPDATSEDRIGWAEFLKVLPVSDLESALTQVPLTQRMTNHVVSTTWDFLNEFDVNIFNQICSNRHLLPLSKLFRHLFQSTNTEINVVTPNYDRLAEYAAEAAGFSAYTGFSFGFLGARAVHAPKIYNGKYQARTVNVWKVHGSFSWFNDDTGVVISLPPSVSRPSALHPVIITPGIEKYRRTHEEPFRTTMQNADAAIRTATSFLCIGYGFNDQHLQTLLVERCQSPNVPLVLLTKQISKTAHEFFQSGRCQKYVALEENGTATRIYSNSTPLGVDIPDVSLWSLSEFLGLVM